MEGRRARWIAEPYFPGSFERHQGVCDVQMHFAIQLLLAVQSCRLQKCSQRKDAQNHTVNFVSEAFLAYQGSLMAILPDGKGLSEITISKGELDMPLPSLHHFYLSPGTPMKLAVL